MSKMDIPDPDLVMMALVHEVRRNALRINKLSKAIVEKTEDVNTYSKLYPADPGMSFANIEDMAHQSLQLLYLLAEHSKFAINSPKLTPEYIAGWREKRNDDIGLYRDPYYDSHPPEDEQD